MADFELLTDDDLAAMSPDEFENFAATENEKTSSFLGVFANSGNKTTRMYVVTPFEAYPDVIKNYLGYAELDGNGRIVRHQPVRDPIHRENFAVRCEVRPFGQRGAVYGGGTTPLLTANLASHVLITLYCESVRYDVGTLAGDETDPLLELSNSANESARYCIKEVAAAREVYNSLPGTYVWARTSDGVPDVNNNVTMPIPFIVSYNDIRVAWLNIPYDAIPFTAIKDCMGKVNGSTMVLPNRPPPSTYDPETLLLQSYSITDGFFADGTRAATLTYFFKERQEGWNVVPAPDGSGFRRVFRKATQLLSDTGWQSIYRKANLDNGGHTLDDYARLFQPEET